MSSASRVAAIAWREFKHTALTKAFIIGTIIFPLIIWGGMLVVPMFVKPSTTTVEGTLAVIDPTGLVGGPDGALEIELDPERRSRANLADIASGNADAAAATEAIDELAKGAGGPFGTNVVLNITLAHFDNIEELESLQNRVRAGEYIGVVTIDPRILETAGTDRQNDGSLLAMFVPTKANPNHVSAIERAAGRAVVRARVDHAGLELEQVRAMLRSPSVETRRLTAEGEAASGHQIQKLLPIAFMILLWIASFASGNYLLTTTIEEKSNKVMEVLLSAVSPLQLMAGKIIGQGIVGLLTISVYAALGLAALFTFSMMDLIQPMQIVYLGVYFFMAYFMVAAIMASIGSAVSDLQEAHALLTPAMLVLMLPMILFIPVSQNPNGTLAVVTSFLPPLSPFVMILRVTAAEAPPTSQIVASMIVGFAGVFAMIWMCAKIFRVGVLMHGKPPSPMELLRWMRQG